MMNLSSSISASLLLLMALSWIPQASAQNVTSDACLSDIYDRMAYEERMYKSVLYGQKKAEDQALGSVRHDKEFDAWMKIAESSWSTLATAKSGKTHGNQQMDDESDIPVRRGIFETRESSTSDLIPPLLQSARALQCRLRTICELARQSRGVEESETISIQVDGCIQLDLQPITSCNDASVVLTSASSCESAVDAIMEREAKLLHLAVTYDAAYRSLLQFGGAFEGFLTDFRLPLLQPLWQTVRALGALNGIPCFLAQCDL